MTSYNKTHSKARAISAARGGRDDLQNALLELIDNVTPPINGGSNRQLYRYAHETDSVAAMLAPGYFGPEKMDGLPVRAGDAILATAAAGEYAPVLLSISSVSNGTATVEYGKESIGGENIYVEHYYHGESTWDDALARAKAARSSIVPGASGETIVFPPTGGMTLSLDAGLTVEFNSRFRGMNQQAVLDFTNLDAGKQGGITFGPADGEGFVSAYHLEGLVAKNSPRHGIYFNEKHGDFGWMHRVHADECTMDGFHCAAGTQGSTPVHFGSLWAFQNLGIGFNLTRMWNRTHMSIELIAGDNNQGGFCKISEGGFGSLEIHAWKCEQNIGLAGGFTGTIFSIDDLQGDHIKIGPGVLTLLGTANDGGATSYIIEHDGTTSVNDQGNGRVSFGPINISDDKGLLGYYDNTGIYRRKDNSGGIKTIQKSIGNEILVWRQTEGATVLGRREATSSGVNDTMFVLDNGERLVQSKLALNPFSGGLYKATGHTDYNTLLPGSVIFKTEAALDEAKLALKDGEDLDGYGFDNVPTEIANGVSRHRSESAQFFEFTETGPGGTEPQAAFFDVASGSDAQALNPAKATGFNAIMDGHVVLVSGNDAALTVAANGSCMSFPLDAGNGGFKAEDKCIFKALVDLQASDSAMFVGFCDLNAAGGVFVPFTITAGTVAVVGATEAIGFMFDSAATAGDAWQIVSAKAGVVGNSGNENPITTAARKPTSGAPTSNLQELMIVLNASGGAVFYIDGHFVGTLTSAVTPTVDMFICACLDSRTTTSKSAVVDYWYAKRQRNRVAIT